MTYHKLVRLTLKLSCIFNLFAAYLLVFPESVIGELAGFTPSNSVMHTTLAALAVGALGFAYAWLAQRPKIDLPLLAFGAMIKAGAFSSFFVLALYGAVSPRLVLFAVVDIILAALWATWIWRCHWGQIDPPRCMKKAV